MGQIISEGLEWVGRISDAGFVFDKANNCVARINKDGYIGKVGGGAIYGKIDTDGTIRDASLSVVGRIQADGYVIIHSKRICKVESSFIESITPKAWNAGESSTYKGRQNTARHTYGYDDSSSSGAGSFFFSAFFGKIFLGLILAIIGMVNGWGGAELLISCPGVIFIFFGIAKLFG